MPRKTGWNAAELLSGLPIFLWCCRLWLARAFRFVSHGQSPLVRMSTVYSGFYGDQADWRVQMALR